MAAEFRRFYKSTMGEYIRRLRVDFACRQISQRETPLTQIALAAGFSSQSHFCTAFRRVTRMTPTEYRSTFAYLHFAQRPFIDERQARSRRLDSSLRVIRHLLWLNGVCGGYRNVKGKES
jgi:AraC-like DNA-binding protein